MRRNFRLPPVPYRNALPAVNMDLIKVLVRWLLSAQVRSRIFSFSSAGSRASGAVASSE